MSKELARQLRTASQQSGSYTQTALPELASVLDPYGQVGVGLRGADSPGAALDDEVWEEKDFNLRMHHGLQTVTNAEGVSMLITPLREIVFTRANGQRVRLRYGNASLQKIVP
jgi:hypothetical protein